MNKDNDNLYYCDEKFIYNLPSIKLDIKTLNTDETENIYHIENLFKFL